MKYTKYILVGAVTGLIMIGCGTGSSSGDTTQVPNNSYVTLDDNETLTLIPGSNVSAIDVGDGSYYITCDGGNCSIQIGDNTTTDDDTTITDVNNTDNTDNSIDNTDNSDNDTTTPTVVNPIVVTP